MGMKRREKHGAENYGDWEAAREQDRNQPVQHMERKGAEPDENTSPRCRNVRKASMSAWERCRSPKNISIRPAHRFFRRSFWANTTSRVKLGTGEMKSV